MLIQKIDRNQNWKFSLFMKANPDAFRLFGNATFAQAVRVAVEFRPPFLT